MAVVSDLVPAATEITTWIACDSCNKWRRIRKDLAESVKDDARWCAVMHLLVLAFRRAFKSIAVDHGTGAPLDHVRCASRASQYVRLPGV